MMLQEIGSRARAAALGLVRLNTEEKNRALHLTAEALRTHSKEIILANQEDLLRAQEAKMKEGLIDRLTLNEDRIEAMAAALEEIIALPDPIGELLEEIERPNGLQIQKRRVPIGVIGIIYEARPNVTLDAFALCFKTSNAVILKGGSDAISSNRAITAVIRASLEAAGICPDAVQLIEATDRETTKQFMRMNGYVDVLIPRGSAALIRTVMENASVPVIETGAGNCHIYIDADANLKMAAEILVNAKTQRIGVCNAAESLLVHRDAAEQALPLLQSCLTEKHVELRADDACYEILAQSPDADLSLLKHASAADWGTEYLDYILSVKMVDTLDEAIAHINHYSTRHSECIVTENEAHALRFLNEVDSACVYWNASTRFTDGGCFGFGAEIGISTAKLHARGPMGLKELTTSKYHIIGNGQVR